MLDLLCARNYRPIEISSVLFRQIEPPQTKPDGHICERTPFVMNRRSAILEKALHGIECVGMRILEYSQPETLSDGGIDAVKDGVGSGALDPFRAAFGKEAPPCFGEPNAGIAFCAF